MDSSILGNGNFMFVIFVLIGAIILLLAIRDIICWFWKINEGISLLEKNNEKQDAIIKLLQDVITATIKNGDETSKNNNYSDLSGILKEIQNDKNSVKVSLSKDPEIVNDEN